MGVACPAIDRLCVWQALDKRVPFCRCRLPQWNPGVLEVAMNTEQK
jgi:hypothetical protein